MVEALKDKAVAYFYDEEVRPASGGHPPNTRIPCPIPVTSPIPRLPVQMTNYNYGGGNPMRPHRVKLTTNLVTGYGLTDSMRLLRPRPRTREEIMEFHADGEPPI